MSGLRARIHVHGHVQGVGFRAWATGRLAALGLAGTAENRPDGTVDLVATGDPDAVDTFVDCIRREAPGRVDQVVVAVDEVA